MEKSLFSLERGDPEKLEGRVLLYSSVVNPHCDNCRYPCIYAGSNPFDVIEPEDRDAVRGFLEQQQDHPFHQAVSSEGSKPEGMAIRKLIILDPREVFVREGDIINAGSFYKPIHASNVIFALMEAYAVKYLSQWEERMASGGAKGPEPPNNLENLASYKPAELKQRLFALAGQLAHNIVRDDKNEIDSIKRTLAEFGNKASSRREISTLVSYLEGPNQNQPLLAQKQIEMIAAIRSEDYELAARCRDEIKALLS